MKPPNFSTTFFEKNYSFMDLFCYSQFVIVNTYIFNYFSHSILIVVK